MALRTPLVVPQMGVVEDVVVLAWLAADGDQVTEGQEVVTVETEKAEVTLEAPATGRLEITVTASDQEVAVGTTLGHVVGGP